MIICCYIVVEHSEVGLFPICSSYKVHAIITSNIVLLFLLLTAFVYLGRSFVGGFFTNSRWPPIITTLFFMEAINRYFKVATLPPFIFAVIVGIILIATHDGSSYKSEPSTSDGFALTVFMTLILFGLITLLSTAIFINKLSKIRNHILISFITWTLLPGILYFYVLYNEIGNFSGASDIDGTYEGNRLLDGYIMIVAIIHFLFLVISFIRFRRTQST